MENEQTRQKDQHLENSKTRDENQNEDQKTTSNNYSDITTYDENGAAMSNTRIMLLAG